MDRKSKIFFTLFFFIVFITVAMAFFKFYILKDYFITLETACDPAIEKCFIYECNPEFDAERSENINDRLSYYKLIEKMADTLPLCDPNNDENCPPFTCLIGENCRELLCDEATKSEGEQCSNPADYLENQTVAEQKSLNLEETSPAIDTGGEHQSRDIFKPAK